MNKVLIGSHVGMSGPDFYLGSVKEAIAFGETTFMFYTGAPQNSLRKPISELKVPEARALLKEAGFDESKIVVHAPYIINLANIVKDGVLDMSMDFLVNELQRTAAMGCSTIVLHPGSSVGADVTEAMKSVSRCLDKVFERDGTNVKVALETMAGKGSEVGRTFDEIAFMIDECNHKERLGVCLDTCHVNDAGYDIHDIDGILQEFDKKIGLNRLLVVHLNDSKNPREAHKDRHENVGFGTIGFETLKKYVDDSRLTNIPKILETPYINDNPPYKKEIEMLLSNSFDPSWRDELI